MQINGLDALNNKLKTLRDEFGNKEAGKALYSSLMYASTPMYQQVRANAPYRTGKLRANIKRRRLTKGASANANGASVAIYVQMTKPRKDSVYYYIFHEEYGARGRPPRPFIRPAFDNNQAGATDRFAQKLGERIDKIMR